MYRIILHIDMDAFFPAIEERENPQFRGKSIIVGADPKKGRGRGVVSSASYRARKYGIHSAMPISKAYQLCPEAVFLPVNMEFYKKVSGNIMEIVKKYSPTWETVSIDETYLDISFLKSFPKAKNLAEKLKKEIFEKEKLISTIGIGPNKLIAKIASARAKPNGLLVIKPIEVPKFLGPLDIQKIPGIGPRTAEILRKLGISKIKDLKKLKKSKLKEIFGKIGEDIYNKARGIDESEVSPEEIIKSIGKEHTFEEDTREPEIIFETFEKIIKEVWQEIQQGGFSVKVVTAICRFQGFETRNRSKSFKNRISDLDFFKKNAKKLLLELLLENKKLVRLIGLRVKVE